MQGFSEVTLSWGDEMFVVPADNQMGLILQIEDALIGPAGGDAVTILLSNPSHARLAAAFGAALRYAGASVSDAEIYLSIQEDLAEKRADLAIKTRGAVMALLQIVSPPVAMKLTPKVKTNDSGATPEKD